jgi:signal transduction histidine kinase
MLDFEGSSDNAAAFNMLTKMDRQVNKLTNLIGDLLDVSKANAGQLNFYFEKIDFNELVKEVIDEMQRTTKTHTIETKLANTEIIEGDRNRLEQVIMNLISNAIKYSPKADKVVITSYTKNNQVRLCVQDFGIGVPASQQSKLFTRFFRATTERKNTFPGLGLGLYISNEIIKRHSGVMDFISEDGKGSTFCFSLPLKK